MSRVDTLSMTTIAAAADVQIVVTVLIWSLGVIGTAFITCLVWFLMRVLHQFENVIEQVGSLKIEIFKLKELFQDDVHRLDIRITKLESWREAMIQASQTQRILEMASHVREREHNPIADD